MLNLTNKLNRIMLFMRLNLFSPLQKLFFNVRWKFYVNSVFIQCFIVPYIERTVNDWWRLSHDDIWCHHRLLIDRLFHTYPGGEKPARNWHYQVNNFANPYLYVLVTTTKCKYQTTCTAATHLIHFIRYSRASVYRMSSLHLATRLNIWVLLSLLLCWLT